MIINQTTTCFIWKQGKKSEAKQLMQKSISNIVSNNENSNYDPTNVNDLFDELIKGTHK